MNEQTSPAHTSPNAEPDADARRTRREFARRTLAAAAATALAPALVAQAQTTSAPRETVAPPNPQPTPARDAADPLLDAYAELARKRFGERLSAEELARVRNDLAGNLRASTAFSRTKLANADEPDFVFKA